MYSLADFVDEESTRIRKDESYEKNYLIGKYGAIPALKSIDILGEEQVWQRKTRLSEMCLYTTVHELVGEIRSKTGDNENERFTETDNN